MDVVVFVVQVTAVATWPILSAVQDDDTLNKEVNLTLINVILGQKMQLLLRALRRNIYERDVEKGVGW